MQEISAGNFGGGSFPDAEAPEDGPEDFLGVGAAGDVADGVEGGAEFLGGDFRGGGLGEAGAGFGEGGRRRGGGSAGGGR
jgi:hypothetical protein